MTDKIKIEIDADTRSAIAELAKLNKSTEEVEKQVKKLTLAQAAWKAANTDLKKLAGDWNDVAEAYGKVALAAAGAAAATVLFASHVEEQERAIRRLGPAFEAVTVATNGVITAQQAMTLQGQIQQAGVQVNERALGALTRAAREYADATGNDASQAIEKLTNAIVNNSEDALAELNLSTARATTSTQTLANVVRELETRYNGVAPAARTLKQDLDKLPDAITAIGAAAMRTAQEGLTALINRFADSSTAGQNFFSGLRRGLSEFAEAGDTLRTADRQAANAAEGRARQDARERLLSRARTLGVRASTDDIAGLNTQQLTQLQQQLDTAAGTSGGPRGRSGDLNAAFNAITGSGGASVLQEAFGGAVERIRGDARRSERDAARRDSSGYTQRTMSAMEAEIERKLRKPGGAGETDTALRTARTAYNDAVAEGMARDAVLVLPDDMPRNRGETLAAYFTRLAGIQSEFNSAGAVNDLAPTNVEELENDRLKGEAAFAETRAGATRGQERTQRRAARDRETRRQALQQDRSLGGGMLRGLGVTGDALETESKLMQGYSDMAVGALGKIGDAFTRHVELVLSGQETIGQALLAGTNEVSLALAREALPRSLMELAAGFAALANPITAVTAPAHFTAAAIYGGVAAGAGLVAGVTGAAMAGAPAAAGAANTSSARAASGRTAPSAPESAAPVTIVVSSLVPPGPRELQGLVNAQRQAGRYGIDRKAPRQVRA